MTAINTAPVLTAEHRAWNKQGRRWGPYVVPLVVTLLAFLVPSNQTFTWAGNGLLWGLWVLSLNIVWGYAGQLSLAQLALGAVSAYTAVVLVTQVGANIWIAMLAGIIAALLSSLLLSVAATRLRGFQFAILTLTFAMAMLAVATASPLLGRSEGLLLQRQVLPKIDVAGFAWDIGGRSGGFYLFVAIIFLLMNALAVVIARSPAGTAMRAVRDDEMMARSVGMNPLRVKTVAFVLSALVAGFAGIVQALQFTLVVPELFSVDQLLVAVMLLVLVGRGNIYAPIAAAAIHVLLYDIIPIDGAWRSGILGAIVIVIVIAVPEGILGAFGAAGRRRRRREELQASLVTSTVKVVDKQTMRKAVKP